MNKKMVFAIVIGGALLLFVGFYVFDKMQSDSSATSFQGNYIELNGKKIKLEVADTEALRVRGLSGHAPLAQDEAMLFIFPEASDWGIWMKDMTFPLDILWLDDNMKVITAEENVSPDSYPKVFRPTTPARYVLESSAGFIARNRIVYQEQLKVK